MLSWKAERAKEGQRFYWLFERQCGLCYLGSTDLCRSRSRMMTLDRPKRGYSSALAAAGEQCRFAGACATWEHLIPRRLTPVRRASALKLLACFDCNAAKGADGEPSAADIERALKLGRAWYRSEAFLALAKVGTPTAEMILIGMEAEAERALARLAQSQGPGR